MAKAIYQKYRPQTFNEVVGHDYIKKVLLNALKNSRLSHAYLFTGSRGTGKTSFARLIAKAVNCLDSNNGDACGKCEVCRSIEALNFIDLIEIDAASNRGIDEIRNLKERVNFVPAEAKKKVYIIDEVHMLTKEAFNALLKTLEEPPEFVIFILATTEPHKIPPTILSRVQRFDLGLGSREEIKKKIEQIVKAEGVKIEDAAVEKIYELGGGSFRDSESILDKILSIEIKKDKKISLKEIEGLIGLIDENLIKNFTNLLVQGNAESLLESLDDIAAQGFPIDQLVNQIVLEIRSRIRLFYKNPSMGGDLHRLVKIAVEMSEAGVKLKDALIPVLPLEIAILNLSLDEAAKPVRAEKVNLPKVKREENEIKKEEAVKKNFSDKLNKDNDILKKELADKWPEIIEKSKKFNHHFFALLSSAKISSIEDGTLILEVGYKFHKQKIESVKSRQIIADLIKELTGEKLAVNCKVNPGLITKTESNEGENDELSNEDIVEAIFEEE